ncbi:MAG: hypothetical protein BWZ00_01884 [Bacteroidetes bacterium ADurb.BinA174]|nr:MAG: hypothetical protein BWZ00_01884 [Bacteroidetes bacterium ADurb.BinA174]
MLTARISVQKRFRKPDSFIKFVVEESGLSGIKRHLFPKFGMTPQSFKSTQGSIVIAIGIFDVSGVEISGITVFMAVLG